MADPRHTKVNVTLTSVDPKTKKGQFTLAPTGSDPLPPPNGPHQVLCFDNDHHDGIDIEFHLIDSTHQGYAFPADKFKGKAVSSQMGPIGQCPPQGTSEVLDPVSISGANNEFLKVHNPNQNKPGGPNLVGDFNYTLWVTNDGGTSWIALDPGGQNMNGPTFRSPTTAILVGAAVIVAAALFAIYELRLHVI